jgi:hypothetical protein
MFKSPYKIVVQDAHNLDYQIIHVLQLLQLQIDYFLLFYVYAIFQILCNSISKHMLLQDQVSTVWIFIDFSIIKIH